MDNITICLGNSVIMPNRPSFSSPEKNDFPLAPSLQISRPSIDATDDAARVNAASIEVTSMSSRWSSESGTRLPIFTSLHQLQEDQEISSPLLALESHGQEHHLALSFGLATARRY